MRHHTRVLVFVACAAAVSAALADPVKSLEARMELARKTFALVEQGGPQPRLAAEFAAIERRVADVLAGNT